MTHLHCSVLYTHVTMDTQFKCCALNSWEAKLREAFKQDRWTLDSSRFLQQDLDMWDTKSNLMAQTSAWCGMASVSGTGFLPKVNASTSVSPGGLRQNDPSLKRWQSLSHLAPESATRPFSPSLGAALRATRGESNFRQLEVVQWLNDAHKRLDTQLEELRARDAQLSYHINTAQTLDMKHKQLTEATRALEQEEGATNLSQFKEPKSQKCRELGDRVVNLEKDLLRIRLTLARESNGESPEGTPGSLSRMLPEKQMVDTEPCRLREAETRTKTQEEDQIQTQRMLLNHIEELNQRLSRTVQNHSEVQEQLTEANNKISHACLEKAILSTEVLKLEDHIKHLKGKLREVLTDKCDLKQEKADLPRAQVLEVEPESTMQGSNDVEPCDNSESHDNKQGKEMTLMKEETKVLREVNENLTCKHEEIKQSLKMLQRQVQELRAESANSSKQITDLQVENSGLTREKEELLSKMNQREQETKDKCCQLRESVEVFQLEKQELQDRCLCLEAKLLEMEEKLQLQEEEHHKKDAVKVQNIKELQAVALHCTEKWQKVALTLQSTQEELDSLKKDISRNELHLKAGALAAEAERLQKKEQKDIEEIDNLLRPKASLEKLFTDNKKESDSLLKIELDACKQELELERSRSQMLLHRYKVLGAEAVQTRDKEPVTDLSESPLLSEPPPDSHSSQNKCPQWEIQNSEVQWLKIKLREREKELREATEALKSLEKVRETEETEAQIKISALELKLMEKSSEDNQASGDQTKVSTTNSLMAELEESRNRVNQLQQEKMLAVQRLQTPKQLHPIKDEKQSVEGRKEKNVCPVDLETAQQRRMVTEQLKNLFKEREKKDAGNAESSAAAAQTEASLTQRWSPTARAARTAVDRGNWWQSSGLMPVFEEDEEGSELLEEEEDEEPGDEDQAQECPHNHRHQNEANINLKAKHENLLQGLRYKLKIQDLKTTAGKVSQSSDGDVSNLCSDDFELRRKSYSLYPDGIFLAERVNICSADEDEEDK